MGEVAVVVGVHVFDFAALVNCCYLQHNVVGVVVVVVVVVVVAVVVCWSVG